MLRFIASLGVVFCATTALAQSGSPDDLAWNQARADGLAGHYQAYLDAQPDGRYTALAFRCVIELSLMPPEHECSVNNAEPGPPGPVQSQIGNFPVSLR